MTMGSSRFFISLAVAFASIHASSCLASVDLCLELLGAAPSRTDLERVSDYAVNAGGARYYFMKRRLVALCKDGKCELFEGPYRGKLKNSRRKAKPKPSPQTVASHDAILRRQNPKSAPVSSVRELLQVASENFKNAYGEAAASLQPVSVSNGKTQDLGVLAERNLVEMKQAMNEAFDDISAVVSDQESLKTILDMLGGGYAFKFIWIKDPSASGPRLYFQLGTLLHYQIAAILFGEDRVKDESFIEENVRGGVVSIKYSEEDGFSYFIDDYDTLLIGSGMEVDFEDRGRLDADLKAFLK